MVVVEVEVIVVVALSAVAIAAMAIVDATRKKRILSVIVSFKDLGRMKCSIQRLQACVL